MATETSLKAEEIAEELAMEAKDALGATAAGQVRLMLSEYVNRLRSAGLLLEWRTDVENAPVGCIALVSIPDAEIPELAMLDRQYGWCRLPPPDGKQRFVKDLTLSPQPTHFAFFKPPEQT